jgi:hypothetical protein
MKIHKLTLLFIALFYMHFNNAMDNEQSTPPTLTIMIAQTEHGCITKIDHRDNSPEIRRRIIEYVYTNEIETFPVIAVSYDIEKDQYSGKIIRNTNDSTEIQNQAQVKIMFERLSKPFYINARSS